MDFIKVPVEFFQVEELNYTELIVLAIYKYYTEEGYFKKCTMSNQEIADLLNMDRRYVIKIKNHLNELGFIKTGKGKEVVYLGINNTTKGEPQLTSKTTQKVNNSSLEGEPQFTSKGEPQFTSKVNYSSLINVKKEKKKKEDKRIGFESLTGHPSNFVVAVAGLPQEYQREEMIDYVKETMGDWINTINSNECDIDQVRSNIKKIILDKYSNVIYSQPLPMKEVKEIVDYIDVF